MPTNVQEYTTQCYAAMRAAGWGKTVVAIRILKTTFDTRETGV